MASPEEVRVRAHPTDGGAAAKTIRVGQAR
jgi:hypothetical protein